MLNPVLRALAVVLAAILTFVVVRPVSSPRDSIDARPLGRGTDTDERTGIDPRCVKGAARPGCDG